MDAFLQQRWPDMHATIMRIEEEQTAFYAFLLARAHHERWRPEHLQTLLTQPYTAQLAAIGLPASKSCRRLLQRMDIHQVPRSQQLVQIADWLKAQTTLPKVLQHASVVPFPWLLALSHQPAMAHLRDPGTLGIDPASSEQMDWLSKTVTEFLEKTTALGWRPDQQIQFLTRANSKRHLAEQVFDIRYRYRLHLLRTSGVQTPAPLPPDSRIRTPRTLADFEHLANEQQHCVDQYFEYALSGACAIYMLHTGRRACMTVELVRERSGLWVPAQIRGFCNRLPQTEHLTYFFRWLARVQEVTDRRSYDANLQTLLRWLSERTYCQRKYSPMEVHWTDQIKVITRLASETTRDNSLQMDLPFATHESPPCPPYWQDRPVC